MNITTSLRFAWFLGLGLIAACGGNTLDGGSTSNREPLTPSGNNPSPGQFTVAQVNAAKAACNAEHGAADAAPTHEDARQKLTGAWFLCSEPNAYRLTKSIEFTADGKYYTLESDNAGGLRRMQGLDGEGSWTFNHESNNYINPGPMFPEFEAGPRRMRITVATSGFQNWYVPLGDGNPSDDTSDIDFDDFAAQVAQAAGPQARNCGTVAINADRSETNCCVATNHAQGVSSFAIYRMQGVDSYGAIAVTRDASGLVTYIDFDSDPKGMGRPDNGRITTRACASPTLTTDTCNDRTGLPFQCSP